MIACVFNDYSNKQKIRVPADTVEKAKRKLINDMSVRGFNFVEAEESIKFFSTDFGPVAEVCNFEVIT